MEAWPPCTMRDSTSLPFKSVPRRCRAENGRLASSTLPPTGEGNPTAAGSPKQATKISSRIAAGIATSSGPVTWASTKRHGEGASAPACNASAPAIPNPRVQQHIEQIDAKRRQERDHGHDQNDTLHHGCIADVDGLQQEAAEPR